jgi:hypothetical protein
MPLPSVTGGAVTSSAETGDMDRGSGNTWNFAPPQYQVKAIQQQQAATQWQSVAFIGGAVALAWLVLRK